MMEFDETLTPEKHWGQARHVFIEDKTLKEIDNIMQKTFAGTENETEKWLKLSALKHLLEKTLQNPDWTKQMIIEACDILMKERFYG